MILVLRTKEVGGFQHWNLMMDTLETVFTASPLGWLYNVYSSNLRLLDVNSRGHSRQHTTHGVASRKEFVQTSTLKIRLNRIDSRHHTED
jgi:hypothetical protein